MRNNRTFWKTPRLVSIDFFSRFSVSISIIIKKPMSPPSKSYRALDIHTEYNFFSIFVENLDHPENAIRHVEINGNFTWDAKTLAVFKPDALRRRKIGNFPQDPLGFRWKRFSSAISHIVFSARRKKPTKATAFSVMSRWKITRCIVVFFNF